MPSSAQKGQYFKLKTKKWLETKGYVVAHLERMLMVAPGRFVKQDQLGSDLLAVNTSHVLFVQVKGGLTWRSGLSAARHEFEKHPYPSGSMQWIVGWDPRARMPAVYCRGINGWFQIDERDL